MRADSYLTKPFSAKMLNSRIHNILTMRRQLAERLTVSSSIVKSDTDIAPRISSESPTLPEMKLGKFDKAFLEKFTALVEDNLTAPGSGYDLHAGESQYESFHIVSQDQRAYRNVWK